ncbi:MAG: hypothetical protein KBG85_07710 [Micropruina sp.]|nr:hypothetical protein [Micropruina sp.]
MREQHACHAQQDLRRDLAAGVGCHQGEQRGDERNREDIEHCGEQSRADDPGTGTGLVKRKSALWSRFSFAMIVAPRMAA